MKATKLIEKAGQKNLGVGRKCSKVYYITDAHCRLRPDHGLEIDNSGTVQEGIFKGSYQAFTKLVENIKLS